MKKTFTLISILLVSTSGLWAQATPNPSFDNWTTTGFPSYSDPDNWESPNGQTAITSTFSCVKATAAADIHSGAAAVKLITKQIGAPFNQLIPGVVTTGTLPSSMTGSITGGIPYTLRPDSIAGWYKYTPASGDNGFAEFMLFGSAANNTDTVAKARFVTPTTTVGTYTRFSAPLVYYSTNAVANSIWLLGSSNDETTAVFGSTAYFDDIELIINPVIPVFLTISAQTNASCNGGCNGTATASASSGTSPYSYLWSNSQTTATATGLCAGSYSITVTDAASQTANSTVTIIQPSAVSGSINPTNVSCNGGNNGTAAVTVSGGSSPYTYTWSNGQGAATATGLSAGTFSVTITDASNCTLNQSVTITQPTALATTMTSLNVSCNNGNDGSVTVLGSGGTSPFTYLWSNGQTTAAATGLTAGTYSVTVTDANSCTKTSSTSISQPNTITVGTSANPASCGSNNGTASAIAVGGTGVLTYLWSTGATSTTITGLIAGAYNVTVSDANGCTNVATANVSNSGGPAVSVSSQTNVSCYGGSTGSATVSATGGATPYTYLWSDSTFAATAANLSAGTYSVSVTDSTGCYGIASVNITEPPELTTTTTSAPDSGSSNGTATVYPSGGTIPYSYQWAPGGQTSSIATGLVAGNYSVTVTDANSCSSFSSVSVGTFIGIQSQYPLLNSQYSIYPNPAENFISIVAVDAKSGNYIIKISNIIGQVLFTETFYHPGGMLKKEVDLKEIKGGLMLVQIRTEDTNIILPLMKIE